VSNEVLEDVPIPLKSFIPPRKGASMTQLFGNSLDKQGNTNQFSSEFCLATVPASPVSSATHSVQQNVQQKLKGKRGRPRKALPLNILASDFLYPAGSHPNDSYQDDWNSGHSVAEKSGIRHPVAELKMSATPYREPSPKQRIAEQHFFHDDYFAPDHIGEDLPFSDDELTTLDNYEKLSRSVEQNAGCSYDIKRIDQSAVTPAPVALPAQKKNGRRRQINPSTCERDYSQSEVEFMNALNEYKRTSGRMFPTCSEILEVLQSLGYEKHSAEPNDEPEANRSIPLPKDYCITGNGDVAVILTEQFQLETCRYGRIQNYFDFSAEN
jgi:hypothetical protein